jgi:AraC-like DNA-binding protein
MLYKSYNASDDLKNFVEEYIFIQNKDDDWFPENDKFIPRIGESIVFQLENSCFLMRNEAKIMLPKAFALGQHVHFKNVIPEKKFDLIIVRLKPASIYTLFHLSPLHFKESHIDLLPIEENMPALFQNLLENSDEDKRIQIIDSFLSDKKYRARYDEKNELVIKVIDKIIENKGCVEIAGFCSLFSVNERTLRRYFKIQIGLSLKEFSLLVKFSNIVQELISDPSAEMIDIVARYNYFDQNHFIHDFKKILGETPSYFFKRDKKNTKIISGFF